MFLENLKDNKQYDETFIYICTNFLQVDATKRGGVARFINHSCEVINLPGNLQNFVNKQGRCIVY